MAFSEEKYPWLERNTILMGTCGSKAYGVDVDEKTSEHFGLKASDEDTVGVCVPPFDYYYGFNEFEQHVGKDPDIAIHSLKKFLIMATKGNPSTLDILWLPEELWSVKTEAGQMLIDNRNIFLTKKVGWSIYGCANHHLKNVINGNGRADYIRAFGYDTKAASHLIRILRMAYEILVLNQVEVRRQDAHDLRNIRLGILEKRDVVDYAQEMIDNIVNQYIPNSSLPDEVDKSIVHQLSINVTKKFLEDKEVVRWI
jgi:predicted nucleotidyltransferase